MKHVEQVGLLTLKYERRPLLALVADFATGPI